MSIAFITNHKHFSDVKNYFSAKEGFSIQIDIFQLKRKLNLNISLGKKLV